MGPLAPLEVSTFFKKNLLSRFLVNLLNGYRNAPRPRGGLVAQEGGNHYEFPNQRLLSLITLSNNHALNLVESEMLYELPSLV